MGLNSLVHPADYYGYSLALGSAEVSLLDLTNAYRVLANGGRYTSAMLLPAGPQTPRRVIDAAAATIVQRHHVGPRGAQHHLRIIERIGDSFLVCGKNRYQQRHARQLVYRFFAEIYGWRMGREF